jgi:hypothetical protein
MNKVATFMWVSLVTAVIAVSAGCARKPAYSDMEPAKSSRDQNQNQNQSDGEQASAPSAALEQPPATAAGAQPEAAPAAVPVKRPSFLDEATGGIKDLPSYPDSYRVSVQVGPIQGLNTMSLGFTARDPMDKISAFFERVIKDNKWTVSDKVIDPEFSEWTLAKGADNNAKVQVKKDEKTGAMTIVMVRSEKLESAGK